MPPLFRSGGVLHYHGDTIRRLFVAAAALWLVAVPLAGEPLPYGTAFQIAAGLTLVALAGLTAPHSPLVIALDTLVAGAAVFMLQAAAISFYPHPIFLFFIREILVIIFLFALYAGVKTLRAIGQGKLGHRPERGEFDQPDRGSQA